MYIKSGDLVRHNNVIYTVALVLEGTFYLRREKSKRLKAVHNVSELEKVTVRYKNVFYCPTAHRYFFGPSHRSYRSAVRVGKSYHKYVSTVEVSS